MNKKKIVIKFNYTWTYSTFFRVDALVQERDEALKDLEEERKAFRDGDHYQTIQSQADALFGPAHQIPTRLVKNCRSSHFCHRRKSRGLTIGAKKMADFFNGHIPI